MKEVQNNDTNKTGLNNQQPALTPHALVEQHMQHPNEPITDADMKNLDTGKLSSGGTDDIDLTPEEKRNADELADAIESDGTDMSYKADI